jgi:ubiquinone/menaquinone biosynthesis C-methylase UbiE
MTGQTLLDVACGTGEHLKYFQKHFSVEGLDLDAGLLEAAQHKLPNVPLHHADMLDFELGRKFDAVTCLFSAIGYVVTLPRLHQAIQTMQRHLRPGGLLIVEPWFAPGQFNAVSNIYAVFVDQPALKIARMNMNEVVGNTSTLHFDYLVGTPTGVEHFKERHELGLFTPDQYLSAFAACGMDVIYDEQGLDGRGLYIGVNPFFDI